MKRFLDWMRVIFDLAIIGFVAGSVIWLFNSDFHFGPGGWEALKYFTVESNILLGVLTFVLFPWDFLIAIKKEEAMPRYGKILLQTGAVGTTLTMLTVLCFLGPTLGWGLMFNNYNLFMHLVTPLVGIVRIVFLENKDERIKKADTLFGVLPMAIYGIFYMVNVISHNGYGTTTYDWYGFGAGGAVIGILVYFLMLFLTYAISVLLFLGQAGINKAVYRR